MNMMRLFMLLFHIFFVRRVIADNLKENLNKFQAWCSQWAMRMNPSKSKKLIVGRSRTLFLEHPNMLVDEVCVESLKHIML